MKVTVTVLFLVLLIAACARRDNGDASIRVSVVGTWTTANVTLPDQTQIKDVTTTMAADGSYLSHLQFNRSGNVEPHITSGMWKILDGYLIETMTNADSVEVPLEQRKTGSSKIILVNSHEMILSNEYNPHREFLRKN